MYVYACTLPAAQEVHTKCSRELVFRIVVIMVKLMNVSDEEKGCGHEGVEPEDRGEEPEEKGCGSDGSSDESESEEEEEKEEEVDVLEVEEISKKDRWDCESILR